MIRCSRSSLIKEAQPVAFAPKIEGHIFAAPAGTSHTIVRPALHEDRQDRSNSGRQLTPLQIETVPSDTIRAGRGALAMSRRALFIWPVIILFLNQLVSFAKQTQSVSLQTISSDLWSVSIFQYMAWYVVFRLIRASDPTAAACRREFAAIVILCLFVYLPATQTIWIAGLGIAICLCIFNNGDAKLRAAGIVLAALSVQEFWGHYLFNLAAPPLLRAETAIVGTVLEIFRPGTVWQDNALTGPNGFGITVYTSCSSFHNFSLALLCWLTISQFRNQDWRLRDLAIGAGIGGTMILLNIFRLCLMSSDIDRFRYWHDGVGSEIFAIGASLVIVCISLYGSRPASVTQ